jgi:L-fucose mutarotase
MSPELLSILHRMGHGDEIVLADAHFPGETMGQRLIRADGLRIAPLLEAIIPLFELDAYDEAPILMMDAVAGDRLDPDVELSYRQAIERHAPRAPAIAHIERFAFYARARQSFAVVMTGETAKYGNVILKKGVTPG